MGHREKPWYLHDDAIANSPSDVIEGGFRDLSVLAHIFLKRMEGKVNNQQFLLKVGSLTDKNTDYRWKTWVK